MKNVMKLIAICLSLFAPVNAAQAEVSVSESSGTYTCTVNIWSEIRDGHFAYWDNGLNGDWIHDNANTYNVTNSWYQTRMCLMEAVKRYYENDVKTFTVTPSSASSSSDIGIYIYYRFYLQFHGETNDNYRTTYGCDYSYLTDDDNNLSGWIINNCNVPSEYNATSVANALEDYVEENYTHYDDIPFQNVFTWTY